MNEANNFPSNLKAYLEKRNISLIFFTQLVESWLIKPQENSFLFAMKNLEGEVIGWQERFYEPIIYQGKKLKSKTMKDCSVWYFYTDVDIKSPIIISEWEIDFLLMRWERNVIGIQWVSQLMPLIQQLFQKWVQEIYICIDNDPPWDSSISNLFSMDKSHLACICDSRRLFAWYKDVGEYVVTTEKIPTMEEIQKYGRNLADYKMSIDAFLHEWKGGGISLDHYELAKWIIAEHELATVKGNIFMYRQGIRKLIDRYVLEQIILKEIELYTKPYNRKIQSIDKNATYDFILSLWLDKNLEKQLMQPGDYNVPLKDGVYNPITKTLIPYRKDMYLFQKFDYEYKTLQAVATPTLFLTTLDSILVGYGEDVKLFLQEFIWSMFVSFTRGKALMLTGSWWNGKWVLADITSYIVGYERVLHVWLQEISSNPQMVYNLIDKYALIDTDMWQGHQLDNPLNKKLISAEPISWKQLYHNPITFKWKVKVWCNCNEMPYLKSIDDSIFRRRYILELKNKFIGKEDFLLVEKLKNEKEAIRKWAMDWLDRLIQRWHFLPPQEIRDQLDSFIHDNDTVAMFLDEGPIEEVENEQIYNKELYLSYRFFCNDGGYKTLSQKNFSKRLKNKGFQPFRDRNWRWFLWLKDDKPF